MSRFRQCLVLIIVGVLSIVFATLAGTGCATTKTIEEGQATEAAVSTSQPFYSCTKDGTWTDEKGHALCDRMCSLYRGLKWDREKRECVSACPIGYRWAHAVQNCVSWCPGGTWDVEKSNCVCPEGWMWDHISGKCVESPPSGVDSTGTCGETAEDEIDRRFEKASKEIDARFQATADEIDKRVEEAKKDIDARYQATVDEINRRFEEVKKEIDVRGGIVREKESQEPDKGREEILRRASKAREEILRRASKAREEILRRTLKGREEVKQRALESKQEVFRALRCEAQHGTWDIEKSTCTCPKGMSWDDRGSQCTKQ